MKSLSRRQVLAGLACGVAGLSASQSLAASTPWTMRLSASSISFSRLPIEQAIERIAGLGFEGIDIWSAHAGCPHLDDVQRRQGPEGLKVLLARHKLSLFAFSVYAGGYPRYAELLGKAGGGVAVTGSAGPCSAGELVPRMKAFLEGLKPAIDLAEEYHSQIAIENHGGSLLDSLDSIRAFVDLNKSPRVGIALAPFHVQARGESVPEAIRAAGPQLLFFYAWLYDPSMSVNQLPGLGSTDCVAWMTALARVQYRGFVNPFLHVEPPPDQTSVALGKSCEYLRTCYRKAMLA